MRRTTRRVWFFAYPGSELLDLAGPWAVLGHANDLIGREVYTPDLVTPAGADVRTGHGLILRGARSPAQAIRLGIPDTVVIAGGPRDGKAAPTSDAITVRWLRRWHREIPRLVSICTGAFILGDAGLLDGRQATTHWRFLDELKRRVPKAHVVDEDIFVRDGRIWTSAGITAGIDLMLALVEEDHGHAAAMAVAKNLVLFLRRSGRQAQFSEVLKRQSQAPPRLRDISAFVVDHLDETLSVERLAGHLGMSPRTLTRWCRDDLQESPATLVRRVRLDEARRLLSETVLPLKDISSRTGLGDPSTLWRTFTRQIGVTPAAYRERFAARKISDA